MGGARVIGPWPAGPSSCQCAWLWHGSGTTRGWARMGPRGMRGLPVGRPTRCWVLKRREGGVCGNICSSWGVGWGGAGACCGEQQRRRPLCTYTLHYTRYTKILLKFIQCSNVGTLYLQLLFMSGKAASKSNERSDDRYIVCVRVWRVGGNGDGNGG